MNAPQHNLGTRNEVPARGHDLAHSRIAIYTKDFTDNSSAAYAEMRRRFGALAPVELAPGVPGTLVIGYRAAVQILHDGQRFTPDPSIWRKSIPPDCPLLPMMALRPPTAHPLYRAATTRALAAVDLRALRATVQETCDTLVESLRTAAESKKPIDLIAQYVVPLTSTVLHEMVGCPPELRKYMAASLDRPAHAHDRIEEIEQAVAALIALKRDKPGDDVASRLVHTDGLDSQGIAAVLTNFYDTAYHAQRNLSASTLLLILTEDRFRGRGGEFASIPAAVNQTVAEQPPLANYCARFPVQPVDIDGVGLPPHQPVIISMAACSSDIHNGRHSKSGTFDGWQLAWGAGACPGEARTAATMTVIDGAERLLDELPDIELAVPPEQLSWHPGPYHHALRAMPVALDPPQPRTVD